MDVFQDFSCRFQEGTTTAILGPSGGGKTTLGRILCGLERQYEGNIFVAGKTLEKYLNERRIGLITQRYSNFEWMNIKENITLGKENLNHRCQYLMERFGLSEYAGFFPSQLSGGLKQRVAVARAIVQQSEIIVFDEAFGSLDEETRFRVLEAVQPFLKESRTTSIFITHRIEEALYIADRVVVFASKPVSSVIDFPVPELIKNRNFYFDPMVIGLRKKVFDILLKSSS